MPSSQRRTALSRLGAAVIAPWSVVTGSDSGHEAADHVQWRHKFGSEDWRGRAFARTPRGFLLGGSDCCGDDANSWLRHVGPTGQKLWNVDIFTDRSVEMYDMAVSEEGITVLGERSTAPRYRLVRLTFDGTVEWRRWIDSEADLWTLARGPRGFLLAGETADLNPGDESTTARVHAVTPDGISRWKQSYDRDEIDAVAVRDGQIIVGGKVSDDDRRSHDIWLQGIRSDGKSRWQHQYGSTADEWFGAVHLGTDRIVYGGTTTAGATDRDRAMLVRTTPGGKFVWRRTVELGTVDGVHGVGSELIVVGRALLPERSLADRTLEVVRLDRWGRVQSRAEIPNTPRRAFGTTATKERVITAGNVDSGVQVVATDPP